eukprot:286032_1
MLSPRNTYQGSSKGQETHMLTSMLYRCAERKETGGTIDTAMMDGDNNGISAIRKDTELTQSLGVSDFKREHDPNHLAKNIYPNLVKILEGKHKTLEFEEKIPKNVFKHVQSLVLLASKSNKHNPKAATESIEAIPTHLADDHSQCHDTSGSWGCKLPGHVPTVKHVLSVQDALTLKGFLADYLSPDKMKSMTSGHSTNTNESWHSTVNFFLPKHKCFKRRHDQRVHTSTLNYDSGPKYLLDITNH